MRILALETASSVCTVAVVDGGNVIAEVSLQVPRAHSTRLMPLIAQMIEESGIAKTDVDGIAVGIGPGSFTGLRIGLATAKGLALALGKPCAGVSTLKAMAFGTGAQIGLAVPMLDAKRGEVFTAVYAVGDSNPDTWVELIPPSHTHISQLAEQIRTLREGLRHTWQFVTLCGDVADKYIGEMGLGDAARLAPAGAILPRAWAVAALGQAEFARGQGTDPDALMPIYLRKSEAETLWEAKKSPSSP
ncbi:MAG TPA: tRNA (adenosine(37)-N6)-threonylcarbamoyltransferase complex dimerization subunit type 1 TsaB [Symbiobacteriaceae bacterium]|nr:tRNA (adenosine(37)-N6)-threonylcarbamoyltransferase complex dimerization subunit type 1 TsaB [Symbiobacteriaceae bacterium]